MSTDALVDKICWTAYQYAVATGMPKNAPLDPDWQMFFDYMAAAVHSAGPATVINMGMPQGGRMVVRMATGTVEIGVPPQYAAAFYGTGTHEIIGIGDATGPDAE